MPENKDVLLSTGQLSSTGEDVTGAMELVGAHCDIRERLEAVPPSAQLRGLWFKILERQLDKRGHLGEYQRYFPGKSPASLRFYPVADFLVRAAVAGALVASPETLHDGLFELTRENSASFGSTFFARTLIRLIANDPRKITQQAISSRRQTTSYGTWEIRSVTDTEVRMYCHEEYVWIESYMRGAGHGSYEMFGHDIESETVLDDSFHGEIRIRWKR